MKKYYILLVALLVVCNACNRSQFATTTRHSSNGKVTYVNHYPTERIKSPKVMVRKSYLKETEAQNNSPDPDRTEVGNLPEPEITTINPAPISENLNLIASTSNEPTIIAVDENRSVGDNELVLYKNIQYRATNTGYSTDTIKMIAPKIGTTMDLSAQWVIKFKNGYKVLAGIIYQSNDTLFYKSSLHSDVTTFVKVEKVDTILKVKYIDSTTGKVVDTRKAKPLGKVGFIFSILGIVPGFGLLFGILAVIFGAVSLRKIKRYPERLKGKGVVIASLIIGILMVALGAILLIAAAIGMG